MIPTNDYLPMPDEPPAVDDRTLDLLVDGELSPAARRELLIQLDRVPDGWRRCALAFLEAQSWREEFGSLSCPAASRPIAPAVRPAGRRYLTRRNLGTAAAMAASFLLALVLSFQMRYGWDSPAPPAVSGPATVASTQGDGPATSQYSPETDAPRQPTGGSRASSPWETVSLPVSRGASPLELPAQERNAVDETWWQHFPSAIPPEMIQALQQSGHQVDLRRQWMPFPMKDGRRLVVPVDEVDVHYVGSSTYQ
jgi:hypothetical protein